MDKKWEQPSTYYVQPVNMEEEFVEFENLEEVVCREEGREGLQTEKQEENQKEKQGNLKKEEGSLGKFKDVESLLNAYNNLQAEFTRKSQKLSEYESKLQAMNAPKNLAEASSMAFEFLTKSDKENVKVGFDEANQNIVTHVQELEESAETNQIILNNPNGVGLETTVKTKEKNLTESNKEEILQNREFVQEFIEQNQELRDSIVISYLESILENNAPKVISKNYGSGGVALSEPPKPKNLDDAKQILSQMFV